MGHLISTVHNSLLTLLGAIHLAGERSQERSGMKISVVIPVLHEGDRIREILQSLKNAAAGVPYEVIVVDGDPAGDTIRCMDDSGVVKFTARQGRASQMNAGAARATGNILLFLHADTLMPEKSFARITGALADRRFIGGAFDLGIQNRRRIFRIIGRCASFKHRLTRVPYGDQAIFMLRSTFEEMKGYQEIPLMEDVELMKRVKRTGRRIIILPQTVMTSSRKWEKDGVFYAILRNWMLQTLYWMGIPAERLVKFYYKES